MPHIRVGGPKIDLDRKRKLAAGVTDVACEVYGISKEHIVVVIEETEPENVAVAGKLIADRRGHN